MDAPLSLDDVRQAVSHLTAALIDHHPLTDDQWDQAISTLHIAREQHGGRIRHLIHVILSAGGPEPDLAAHSLPDALSELHCYLAVADEPPDPPPSARHRRQRAAPRIPHTQLELFSRDPPPTGSHDGECGEAP